MAKKKSKKSIKAEKSSERVTFEAIQAMSDSDGEEIPESQWNTKAKNLKQAIKDGKFDDLLNQMKGMEDESEDEIEEATLDSNDDSEKEEEDTNVVAQGQEDESESASEESEEGEGDDDDEEDEDDEVEKEEKGDDEEKVVENESNDGESENSSNDDNSASEDDEEDEEDEKIKKLRVNNSQNSKALAVVTSELVAAHSKLPWAETFDIIAPTPLPFGENGDEESNPLDVHDDLKREVAFYNMALEAVHEARKECKKAKVPFSRPEDFFAEMIKTDDHMAKVKDRLIFENKKMEAVAQRKANREQKLRAKESQSNKLAEKAKRKREHFQQVEEWANSAARNRGGALQDDADDMYLNQRGPNKKRQAADKKFGYGGKTGRFKQNSRQSMNDMSGYNPRGNFAGGMKKSAKSKGGSGANRQGKRARDARRSRS